MNSKLRLVLDTNVFLVSILPHHKYWWVFEALLSQQYTFLVNNEILTEYLEKCVEKYGSALANERLDFLLELSNVELITTYYHWYLIKDDPDDDKFVDCAVAGQTDYLVTHDKDYNVLNSIPFPPVNIIRLDALKDILALV